MSEIPTGYNTPGRTAPQGENRENPPPPPGAMPDPDPSYPEVPTGIYAGGAVPADWPRPMNPKDAAIAAEAILSTIKANIEILEKVIGRWP